MRNGLSQYYLQPYHNISLCLDFIKRYFKRILFFASFSLLIYPIMQNILLHQQHEELQHKNQQQQTEWQTQMKLLAHFTQNQQALTDQNMAKLNQQLKTILTHHHANIENIQWQIEPEKRVNITFTQNTKNSVAICESLLALNHCQIHEITLNKLNQDRLIQADIQLSFHQE